MGALIVAIAVMLGGAAAGGAGAMRLARALTPGTERSSRWTRAVVSLLGAIAAAEIANAIYNLVHSLQLNPALYRGFGGRLLHSADLFTVTDAIRAVMFNGILLAGLAVVVALLASRRRASAG